MTPDQLTSLTAYWPACLQCALWATGIGMMFLLAALVATVLLLSVAGATTRVIRKAWKLTQAGRTIRVAS